MNATIKAIRALNAAGVRHPCIKAIDVVRFAVKHLESVKAVRS